MTRRRFVRNNRPNNDNNPDKKKKTPKKKSGPNPHAANLARKRNRQNRTEKVLTRKQAAFVREYLVDLNATQAAIRAGYSAKTAGGMAFENLKKPEIAAAVQKAIQQRAKRTEVTADRVVRELAKIAFSDMRSFARWKDDNVQLLDSTKLSAEDAACVSEVSHSPGAHGSSVRFRLHDKRAALELLGKHTGVFMDTIRHVGDADSPITHAFDLSDDSIKKAYQALYNLDGEKDEEKEEE